MIMSTRLVRDTISRDVVEALETLAEGARSGAITGAIFGIIVKGRSYHVNVAGSLVSDPTLARGICAALDDELMQLVQSSAGPQATD